MRGEQLSVSTLAGLCALVTDGTHDTPKTLPSGYPLIKGKDISRGYVDFSACDYISQAEHRLIIKRSKPEFGDTLFANIGSLGDVAFVDTSKEFSIKNVALFKPNPKTTDARYFFYLLKSPMVQSELLAQRAGAAQPFLGLAALRSFQVRYHGDIETQRRIASILGAYDDLIEVNRRRVKLLGEMAHGLFEEWFVRFRFPGHETIPLLDTPNGKLPEGWEWEKVASILKKIGRPEKVKTADYLSEGTIPCIDQGSDFVGGYTDNADALISDPLPICVFGDHTRILKFVTFPFASGADGTQLLYPDERISPEYLFLSLEAIDLSNQFYARHFKFLKEQLILIPRHDLVEKFDVIARPALQLIQKFRDQNIKLAASRDLLVPRLISGQLSVEAAEQQLAAE